MSTYSVSNHLLTKVLGSLKCVKSFVKTMVWGKGYEINGYMACPKGGLYRLSCRKHLGGCAVIYSETTVFA